MALTQNTNPTAKDIARLAGVSQSTVAKALAGNPKVRKETARRIEQIAHKIGYKVNSLARQLKSGRTNTVGLILPQLHDPFYAQLVEEYYRALDAEGFRLVFALSADKASALKRIEDYLAHWVDGIVWDLSYCPECKDHAAELARQIPLVVIGGGVPEAQAAYDHVVCADRKGGYEITRHALERGHRQIAFIGPLGVQQVLERIEGYRQALAEAGVHPNGDWLIDASLQAAGMDEYEQWAALSPRPTAIFTFNDALAINMLGILQAHGFRVPEDVALMGFDNIPLSEQLYKPLTTVDLCSGDFAKTCVKLLLARIGRKRKAKDWHYESGPTLIDTQILTRATTAPPKS